MSWPSRIPGPEQLADAPELAALELLEVALALATNALLAQNGELGSDDFIRELAVAPSVCPCLADAILNHIIGLEKALARYRDYIDAAVPKALSAAPDL